MGENSLRASSLSSAAAKCVFAAFFSYTASGASTYELARPPRVAPRAFIIRESGRGGHRGSRHTPLSPKRMHVYMRAYMRSRSPLRLRHLRGIFTSMSEQQRRGERVKRAAHLAMSRTPS
jgi:hypothetical protein